MSYSESISDSIIQTHTGLNRGKKVATIRQIQIKIGVQIRMNNMKQIQTEAVIISRVSLEEQKNANNSLPAQTSRLENYCRNNGFKIIKRFSFDESAYTSTRKEFDDKVLSYILNLKKFAIICFDKVDRLSRNVFDKRVALLYEKTLRDEIELHFPSDNQVINSRMSAVEKFHFGISLGLAKYYSDAISDNVKRALEKIRERGKWPGKAPIGYKNIDIGDDKKDIVVDEPRAILVRKLFEKYATNQFSMELLRRWVTQEGLKNNSKKGKPLTKSQVDHILRNPFYFGQMRIKGELYEHKYEPIITKELFQKVQSVKQNWHKQPFQYAAMPFLYRGLLHCNTCHSTITFERKKQRYVYGHCTNAKMKCPKKVYVREEAITDQIRGYLKSLYVPQELMDELLAALKKSHESKNAYHSDMMKHLQADYDQIEKRIEKMYDDKLDTLITQNEYEANLKRYKAQQQELLEQMEHHRVADETYYVNANKIFEVARRASELFEQANFEEKQELLRFLLSNSAMDRENLVPTLQKPFDILFKCQKTKDWLRRGDSLPQPSP